MSSHEHALLDISLFFCGYAVKPSKLMTLMSSRLIGTEEWPISPYFDFPGSIT